MDLNENFSVTKAKSDKEASKAVKKQQKEERKAKSLCKTASESAVTTRKTEDPGPRAAENKNKEKCQKNTLKSDARMNVKLDMKHTWFKHLFQAGDITEHTGTFQGSVIHQNFITLGLQFGNNEEYDSTRCCELFLNATSQLVKDFVISDSEDFPGCFLSEFDKHTQFLNNCRPLSIAIYAAIKYIKYHLMRMTETNNALCKIIMSEVIDRFISERIEAAHNTIVSSVSKYIKNGYCILVYSFSQLILKSILFAWNQVSLDHKDKFHVVIIDTFPCSDTKIMIEQLKLHHIPFCEAPLSSIPMIIKKINIILLDSHSVFSNNNVMSRSGSASIANIAKLHGKPVIVCAETFKFNTHGQLDVSEKNELGSQNAFMNEIFRNMKIVDDSKIVKNWRQNNLVTPVDLLYDIIPHKMISLICSELGYISPTTNLKQPIDY